MTPSFSNADIVLVNGLILADPASPQVARHGRTVISGSRLLRVNEPCSDPLPAGTVIDCSGCLILPGLVNAHVHGAMSLLRGLADDLPLDTWLNDYMFPAEAKFAGPEFVRLGTQLSALEMALGGITTCADAYFYMEHAARAVCEVGIRGVIAQGILDVPAPDAPSAGDWKRRVGTFFSAFPDDDLVTPALFCHSPYLCGPDTLREAAELSRKRSVPFFSHVSETAWEVNELRNRYQCGPVAHLKDVGILGKDFIAVHVTHVSDAEMDMLAESRTGVVHCPEANMKLGSGAAPVSGLLQRGVIVGIGTDGPASNNNLDLFEEMRSASLLAKVISGNPEALDARTVLRMATIDGAALLGLDDRTGSLAPGKFADLVILDLNRPHLTPAYDLISHLVYSAKGSDVRDLIVNGKVIVDHGRITTIDEEALKAAVRKFAERIRSDMGVGKPLGAEVED
ncbi:MAG: amidohydrolase family protein [Deltaproteobacteria bacterium]